MVQRVQVILEDDIDGSPADQTIHFGWKGTEYEIDLSEAHVEEFAKAMDPWLKAARRSGTKPRGRRRTTAAASTAADPAVVREWARKQGYKVSDRGRVSAEIMEAYAKAH